VWSLVQGYNCDCQGGVENAEWYPEEERQFPKSWCKLANPKRPDLAILGMKYALSKGAATLVPPGDYHNYKKVGDRARGYGTATTVVSSYNRKRLLLPYGYKTR